MQLGHTRLSPEEKERRRRQNLCLYCGQPGHFLVDSGADESIMDRSLALRLGLHPEKMPSPISARALDGHVLGRVISRTNPVHMLLLRGHRETIQFMLLSTPNQPVILGHSWLRRYNPNIDWSTCHLSAVLSQDPFTVACYS